VDYGSVPFESPPDDLGDLLDHARHERRSPAEGEREG